MGKLCKNSLCRNPDIVNSGEQCVMTTKVCSEEVVDWDNQIGDFILLNSQKNSETRFSVLPVTVSLKHCMFLGQQCIICELQLQCQCHLRVPGFVNQRKELAGDFIRVL